MVSDRGRAWVVHCAYESPHNGRSPRMSVGVGGGGEGAENDEVKETITTLAGSEMTGQ